MKHLLISIATTCIMFSACNTKKTEVNPFFTKWETPFGIPPFEMIDAAHYLPAFEAGFAQHNQEIDSIAAQAIEPNFKNTIEGIDFSGELLNNVTYVFFNLTDAETNDSLQTIAEEISPRLSEHDDNIYMNDALFARVKMVYDNQDKENLTPEQKRVLDLYYKNFVRSGALLDKEQKDKLKQINKELALLQLKFDNNVLEETNNFALIIEDKEDLEGLPQGAIDAAAEAAKERNLEGKWVITLHNPSWIPFLQYAKNRKLREQVYTAYIKRGDNGNSSDNNTIINKIINLRIEKAKLLGHNTFADYVLDETMAKKPENVMHLLTKIWEKATPRAIKEVAEMQAIADREGANIKIAAWDWWYYAEKVRAEK
ncbi:MAG: M3 family metallopeptidase, partial [Bacteroidales bacterium]